MSVNLFTRLELTRPLAIVQVDATGRNPQRDRIVAVTIRRIELEGDMVVRHHWVNPGVSADLMLQMAQSTDPERLVRVPTFRTVRFWLRDLLDGCDLAGYGLKRFDLPILQAEFARANDVLDLSGRAIIDCQQIVRRLRPDDLEAAVLYYLGRRLSFGVTSQKRTGAMAMLLDALLKTHPFLPRTPEGLSRQFGASEEFRRGTAERGREFAASAGSRWSLSERLRAEPDMFYPSWCRYLLEELADQYRRKSLSGCR